MNLLAQTLLESADPGQEQEQDKSNGLGRRIFARQTCFNLCHLEKCYRFLSMSILLLTKYVFPCQQVSLLIRNSCVMLSLIYIITNRWFCVPHFLTDIQICESGEHLFRLQLNQWKLSFEHTKLKLHFYPTPSSPPKKKKSCQFCGSG